MALKKKISVESVQDVPETQLQIFDRAVKLFRAGQYTEARPVFEKAAEGSVRAVAHNARLHINMCDRRLFKPQVRLNTAEDFYNVGVERMNARNMESARECFARAVELTRAAGDSADHIYYAFSACCALAGDSLGAYENLRRAIEIDSKNRLAARHDPDFSGSAQQSVLQPLLYPEKQQLDKPQSGRSHPERAQPERAQPDRPFPERFASL